MAIYYAQSVVQSLTGDSADSSSNTFAWNVASPLDDAVVDDLAAAMSGFYQDLVAGGMMFGYSPLGAIAKFLVATTAVPNYPLFQRNISWGGANNSVELPEEVALCASYANDTLTSVSPKRRRGRIYISGHSASNNTSGRPTTATQTALATAYRDYVDACNDITGVTAGVWSRTDAVVYNVERIWVDNEWDTMRSRGGKSTARVTLAPSV